MSKPVDQQIPTWRHEPEHVSIKVALLGKDWRGHLLASFKVGGREYVALVTPMLIDETASSMPVVIIADVGDKFLVDLPGESLSAGSRILVNADDLLK